MISVAEALAHVTADLSPLPAEDVPVGDGCGRVRAADLAAKLTQPPFPASAMDGYAVRATDVLRLPTGLTLIGEAAAGHPFAGRVGAGEAVRIFTGAPVPDGADLIVIQEDADRDGARVVVRAGAAVDAESLRARGLDFREGGTLLAPGRRLGPREL